MSYSCFIASHYKFENDRMSPFLHFIPLSLCNSVPELYLKFYLFPLGFGTRRLLPRAEDSRVIADRGIVKRKTKLHTFLRLKYKTISPTDNVLNTNIFL